VGFVKEDDIEFFAAPHRATSLLLIFFVPSGFGLKDFALAVIVQGDHFLDQSIDAHPSDTGTPVGDNADF
jgi:hypothetical protein